jgi:hypothetical protein
MGSSRAQKTSTFRSRSTRQILKKIDEENRSGKALLVGVVEETGETTNVPTTIEQITGLVTFSRRKLRGFTKRVYAAPEDSGVDTVVEVKAILPKHDE